MAEFLISLILQYTTYVLAFSTVEVWAMGDSEVGSACIIYFVVVVVVVFLWYPNDIH